MGELGLATLTATTRAVRGGSTAADHVYDETARAIAELGRERDELAARIAHLLDDAWFHGQVAHAAEVRELIEEARRIIDRAEDLASRR
jgi:16S rRNA G1207 methylase RsmC